MEQSEKRMLSEAMGKLWKFFLKWSDKKDPFTGEEWDAIIQETHDIWEEYGRRTMITDMIVVYMNELERMDENRRGDNARK